MNPAAASPPSPTLHGLVLAGGRSSRMGTDKASLVHPDGCTMARRSCDLLKQVGCTLIALSLRANQALPAGLDPRDTPLILRDPANSGGGPLAGMLAAFSHAPTSNWLVVACDLPRLDATALRHLLDAGNTNHAVAAYRSEFDGLPEPLCALYRPHARPLLQSAARDGCHCPRKILINAAIPLLDPVVSRALENANTPDEWHQATPS